MTTLKPKQQHAKKLKAKVAVNSSPNQPIAAFEAAFK
jgi:hypothetical protein